MNEILQGYRRDENAYTRVFPMQDPGLPGLVAMALVSKVNGTKVQTDNFGTTDEISQLIGLSSMEIHSALEGMN